ncbi:MAG: DUF3857 domain-containing protein [Polyangiaceae bacterium]|nr:DUF3857 domain-containing protein [Polyangiaceae bacterium]
MKAHRLASCTWLAALGCLVAWSLGATEAAAQPAAPPAARPVAAPPASLAGPVLAELALLAPAGARPEALVSGYAALRELSSAWDEDDPDAIEAALAASAADAALPAQLRAYAGLLEAHARRRRGDLVGAVERVRAQGFATEWLVVGPFDNENRSGLAAQALPERELAEPVVLDRAFEGKVRPVHWRALPRTGAGGPASFGWLDLGALLEPRAFACVYATTFARSTAPDARPATLWVGGGGAFELFFEDALVLTEPGYRDLDADRFAAAVSLPSGYARVTVKVCGDAAPPLVSLRLGDAAGAPLADVAFEASAAASTHAAAALRHRKEAPRPATSVPATTVRPVLGPMQLCEPALAADGTDAALADACARYLLATHGQATGSHAARDMARRVAERGPSFARAMRAARLSSERNEAARWLDQAAPLASTRHEQARLAVARAELARLGTGALDATPLYELALRLEPDDVSAVVGKAQLYAEAGLRRSALELVEAGLALRPSAAALLRLQARELRALARDSDAGEVESRYAALRFDDTSFGEQQLGFAVARREPALVRHWTERLLAVQPGSPAALSVAARALRAAGDATEARACYLTALELAPEDLGTLGALGELAAELGGREEQAALLRRIVELAPQDVAARAHLEHVEPSAAPDDERYAWSSEQLLALRTPPRDPATGAGTEDARRTLRRLAVTTVFDNGLARRFYQVAYEPLTPEAAAQARQYSFFYHSDRQLVALRAAKVYRANGRVDEAVETGSVASDDPSIAMYSLQRAFYVQFPRIEPGDVVELRYRVDDVGVPGELAEAYGEVEPLQDDEPIASAEVVLVTPASRRFHVSVTPLPGLLREEKEVGGRRILRLHARDVPPLRREPRMPPGSELLAQVHVSSFADWGEVGRWYASFAHDKLAADEEVRRQAHELAAGLSDVRAKVAAVYRFVANRLRYVALEFGVEGIRPRPAALTLARGWGDCKDKAALIVSMLGELGIDAEMVLVRTALRGGLDTTVASLAAFDHAIAYVPALDLYLDGTAELTGTDELPMFDRGAWALRVTPQGGKLLRLPEPAADRTVERKVVDLVPRRGGGLDFTAELTTSGGAAASARQHLLPDATRRERVRDSLGLLGGAELLPGSAGLELDPPTELERPVRVVARGDAQAVAERGGWAVPLGPGFRLTGELAPTATRTTPLVLGLTRTVEEVWRVEVPAGARVVSVAAPVRVESPLGLYSVDVVRTPAPSGGGEVLAVTSTLRLDRARIEPADYAAWRRFCEAVDGALGPRVVLAW